MSEQPQPQYLKLEDLQSTASPAAFETTTGTQPASVIIHSKPAKKRKSWGLALPEPTTNLPPRKRAKTEDEKEQRRIERIKRNRAAAHNSRERKRQETENLAVLLARARAELDAYRRLHGPLPADVVLPEVKLNKDPYVPWSRLSLKLVLTPPAENHLVHPIIKTTPHHACHRLLSPSLTATCQSSKNPSTIQSRPWQCSKNLTASHLHSRLLT